MEFHQTSTEELRAISKIKLCFTAAFDDFSCLVLAEKNNCQLSFFQLACSLVGFKQLRFPHQDAFTVRIASIPPTPSYSLYCPQMWNVTFLWTVCSNTHKGRETSSRRWGQIDSGFGRNLTRWFQMGSAGVWMGRGNSCHHHFLNVTHKNEQS